MTTDGIDPLQRAQLLLTVLDEGRRTATYKLAVLLALLDCCAANSGPDGKPSDRISTRLLAERVVELYWRQVRDSPDSDGRPYYRQSSQERAVTVEAVRGLWELARATGVRTLAGVALAHPDPYAAALDVVELNLVRMPLGKLQRPAGWTQQGASAYPRFLYDDAAFHEGVGARQLARAPMEVVLADGVAAWLVSLGGLLRPLLELHWTRAVAHFNHQELAEDRLRDFLFGAERVGLADVREGLRDLQDGSCFYCGSALPARGAEVDHFIPWSRVPNDALGNLVLADRACNNSKRDHLADLPLLERWGRRSSQDLARLASERGWPLQADRSLAYARGLYSQLPLVQQLWVSPGVFRVIDQGELRTTLQLLDP